MSGVVVVAVVSFALSEFVVVVAVFAPSVCEGLLAPSAVAAVAVATALAVVLAHPTINYSKTGTAVFVAAAAVLVA